MFLARLLGERMVHIGLARLVARGVDLERSSVLADEAEKTELGAKSSI